ncbi:MAG: nucleotidyltransferase family protein [Deltaproteobacteria bacterium]|nr:nucleotidyltransferase family protein [Deltaproteobacteria bacterium]
MLVPVAGVPMIVRVVRTLRAARTINHIVVCTDDPSAFANLDELYALVPSGTLSFSLSTGQSPSESVMQYLRQRDAQQPILVTTADHPLLTPEMVDYFCTAAASAPADVAVGIVAESTFRRQYPHSKRSFFPLKDDSFCGTNLFALLTPAAMAAVQFWNHAGQFRKRPWRLIGTFGLLNLLRFALRRPDLATVVPRASRVIGARAAAVPMPFPECAIDVDTLDDLETATRIVQERKS